MTAETLKVLYVDDTESQRYAISRMLSSNGYDVYPGSTGQQGLDLAHEIHPDVIVLDVKLPDIDGFEVCRRLKSAEDTRDIPILQVSASFTSPEDKATALDSGADGYLTTPLNAQELTATIRALVRTRRAREEAERQYRNMRAVFDNAMDAMVIWDDSGKFIDINPSACQLFGLSRNTLLGRSVEEFLPEEDRAEVIGSLRPELLGTGRRGEFRLIDARSVYHHIEYTATVDFLPGRHLSVMRDVTERKNSEREIREFNHTLEHRVAERTAELQETNRELEAFSYSVSHDLRAPFRHIAGFAQLLQKHTQLDPQALHYVETISDAAKHAGKLVDDLLAFSRMARTELRSRRVSLDGMVSEILREIALETGDRNIQWTIHRLGTVIGDGDMLKVALRNLISNAVKYSSQREVAIIEVGVQDRGNETVVYVRDNGVGFNMRYADKLFGVFQRLHSTEEFEGTGIGLASVRRIIHRHGGQVWADAAIDQGATFYISLPKLVAETTSVGSGNNKTQEQSSGGTEANTAG